MASADLPVTKLGFDEIAIRKGLRYATVFYDLDRWEVVGMLLKRRESAVARFFRRWGKPKCRAVHAVCMDLWAPHLNSVRRHLKRAVLVYDKFHVYTYLSGAIADGILAYFTHRITNGISEGINNLIKAPERRAYGFGDFRYFTLTILDATGVPPPPSTLSHPQF